MKRERVRERVRERMRERVRERMSEKERKMGVIVEAYMWWFSVK